MNQEVENVTMRTVLKTGSMRAAVGAGSVPIRAAALVNADYIGDEFTQDPNAEIIPITFRDVEEVVIPTITDDHGRLADIVEAVEKTTGASVIPLTAARIAPEVVTIQRHEIFELNGERYAMADEVREGTVTAYTERVRNALSSGVPFVENLTTTVTYLNTDYNTIGLSRAEWEMILSKFRTYKSCIKIKDKMDLVMEVYPEHV